MMRCSVLLVVLVCVLVRQTQCSSIDAGSHGSLIRARRRGRAELTQRMLDVKHGRRADIAGNLLAPQGLPQQSPVTQYITQKQDHFDGTNHNTWQQEFFVNDTFWKGHESKAPIFLCVGGEGPPLTPHVLYSSVHCNIAAEWLPETGAILFAVQHRYYGCVVNSSACPVPVANFTSNPTESLRFLSSHQALEDLAAFVGHMRLVYGLTSDNKWVSFGGSYPGMMAGWLRLKFPQLIHASVASSAPVEAVVDMVGYCDVQAAAYEVSDNNVGGSPACRSAITTGHAAILSMFQTDSGRQKLASLFGQTADWYADPTNQLNFAGDGVAYFPAQENDPSTTAPASTIGLICDVMLNASLSDPVYALAELVKQQSLWVPEDLQYVSNTTLNPKPVRGRDGALPDFWSYQTCTEFGFYQTCEVGSGCMFAQGLMTLATQDSFCQSEFGISPSEIQANVDSSNLEYGGRLPAGECVLYPNGEVDPWHAQGVLKSPSPALPTLWVPGASHHFWTHPSMPTDQSSVVEARSQIRSTVEKFLSMPCDQPTSS